MKRSTRISLLVFTICAAILAFGALWYTMPGTPSYVIEEAKQRQNVPLLEVSEPATRLPAPKVNYDLLAEKVTPKIKDSLLNDESFINSVVIANKAEIQKAVQQYTDNQLVPTLETKISDLIFDLSTSLSKSLKSDLSIMIDEKVHDGLQNEINSIDVNSYLPQLVDSLTPIVVEKIYNEIELNKEDFIQSVEVEVDNDEFSEDDIKQLYIEYRKQIINDLVPPILDNIELYIRENFDIEISDIDIKKIIESIENQEDSIKISSAKEEPLIEDEGVEKALVEDEGVEKALVEDEGVEKAFVEDEGVEKALFEDEGIEKALVEDEGIEKALVEDEGVEKVLVEDEGESEKLNKSPSINATIVAQVPEVSKAIEEEYSTEKGESISIPTFTSTQSQVLNAEDYESLRNQIRKQAIDDALNILSNE